VESAVVVGQLSGIINNRFFQFEQVS
jgi:hypothetical protein